MAYGSQFVGNALKRTAQTLSKWSARLSGEGVEAGAKGAAKNSDEVSLFTNVDDSGYVHVDIKPNSGGSGVDKKWIGDFSDGFDSEKVLSKKREALVGRLSRRTSNGYAYKEVMPTKVPVGKGVFQTFMDLPNWKKAAYLGGTGLVGYGAYEVGDAMFGGSGGSGGAESFYYEDVPYQASEVGGYYEDPYVASMGTQYAQPQYPMGSQYPMGAGAAYGNNPYGSPFEFPLGSTDDGYMG